MGFHQGLSGLNAASKNLDVIGNNVANTNTVGFKQSQAQFADVYNAAQGGTSTAGVGVGVKVADIAQQFLQGNVSTTSNPVDLAIHGQGFFRMQDKGEIVYSRNGQFQINKDGFITNSQGLMLTGYPLDPVTGTISEGTTAPLQLPTKAMNPKPSSKAEVGMNLDSRELPPRVSVFNPIDPESYNNSTAMTTFDLMGNEHVMKVYFQKQPLPANTWNTYVTVDNQPANPTAPTAPVVAGAPGADGAALPPAVATPGVPTGTFVGTLTFNETGGLESTTPTVLSVPGGIVFAKGSLTPQEMTLSFNDSTQFGAQFAVTAMNQDGYTSGQLSGYSTAPDGVILGRYTNGQSKALGQVVLANFANVQGLQPKGNNAWSATADSGQALSGEPGTASLGVLQSGAVEDSNVDLTSELVNMIMAQRVYQANAQTIKTQDSLLQTIVNLR